MKKQKGLFEEKELELNKSKYYRQRFDACPHFMFFLGVAHGGNTNKSKYPFGQNITLAYFSKNTADWLHITDELELSAQKLINAASKNQNIAADMIKHFKPEENKFYNECKKLEKTDLTKISDKELLKKYRNLEETYVKKLNPSPIIDGYALSTDKLILNKIQKAVNEKGRNKEFIKIFETLTSPIFISFLQDEEIALLKLAEKINKSPLLRSKLIEEHRKKYFWIHNNYVKDEMLGVDYFSKRISKYRSNDLKNKVLQINNNPKENLKRKNKLIKQLHLDKNLRTLLRITDLFNQWQDERKKGTFFATHYFSLLLEEFSRRTKYSLLELKYVMPTEMESALKKSLDKEELKKRFEGCLFLWTKDNYELTTDKKLIEKIMNQAEHTDDEKEIRGMSVSLGRAVGKVKIIESAEEIHKINKGDVLVAVMTRPDYVSGMKKACAIITDEGGITCHAAIVARELKIPCIVGTKKATKILKEGQMVEVDANHGIIRIIKK